MEILVDTSLWSLALRRKGKISDVEQALTALLADLIREKRARLIGSIRQELLSGIRDLAAYERLRKYLHAFPDEPLETSDYERAAHCFNQCRLRGIAGSPADFLICAVALDRNWQILTTDADFKAYANVIPILIHPHERRSR